MARTPRVRQPGSCGACRGRWQDDDRVILTRSGDISCEMHRHLFVPDSIVAAGSYRDIRAMKRATDAK